MVTAQAGHVEVEAGLLGKPYELAQPREVRLVGPIGGFHEPGELEVDPHDVGAEGLHLPEVLDDGRPLLAPVVFQQPAGVVAVVIEPPDHHPLVRPRADEVRLVLARSDIFELAGRWRDVGFLSMGRSPGPRQGGQEDEAGDHVGETEPCGDSLSRWDLLFQIIAGFHTSRLCIGPAACPPIGAGVRRGHH